MAGWFGHTQTLTSISKSVSTVASGILGLEDNLATFMKKVIYYDKFFQRVRANLPKEVSGTAERLFARCYEYRDEIRDELESSLAYVADAGRWVVGMEDWNSKMEKRLHQISELVLLANSLLVEYAMTGKLGGEGSKDELDAYLRNIASSVVLKNQKKKVQVPSPDAPRSESKLQPVIVIKSNSSGNMSVASSTDNTIESLKKDVRPSPVSIDDSRQAASITADLETESPILDGPLTPLTTSSTDDSDPTGGDTDDDDDSLNPFARDYQPPGDKRSLASSLASLANESSPCNSSIPDLATYDADADTRYPHVHLDHQHSDYCGDEEDGDEPNSPVNLLEYECLDMDSIPKYDAFKPSIRSRIQRMNAVPTNSGGVGMHTMNSLNHSLRPYHSGVERTPADNGGSGNPASMQSSFASSAGDDRFQFADSTVTTTAPASATISSKMTKRRPKRMMDMSYSYDFQREQDYNPFISPQMTFLPANAAINLGDIETPDDFELSSTPKIEEEPSQVENIITEQEGQSNTRIEEQIDLELSMPVRLGDYDETEALMAALAAASEDDYNLFGEAHELS